MICKCTTRTLLGALAIAFLAAAIFLWIVAGYVIVDYRNYNEFVKSHLTLIPAVILIIVGIAFFFGSLLGFCSIIRDNKCSLCMFGSWLLLITALLLAAGIAAFVNRGKIDAKIHNKTMEIVTENYEMNKTSLVKQVDWLQENLQCCGADDYHDWFTSKWYKQVRQKIPIMPTNVVPRSCCKNETSCGTQLDYVDADVALIYTDGCYNKFQHAFEANLKLVGGVAIGLIVILCLGVISSCILMRIYREEDTPYYSLYS